MRKTVILVLLTIGIFVGFASCSSIYNNTNTIKGDGNIVALEETLSTFEEMSVCGSAEVNFYTSSEYRAVIAIDSNLLEHVDVYTKNNTLHIGMKNGSYSITKYTVDVYCPHIKKVSVSGSGSFLCADKMVVQTFDAKISGSGKIKGTFTCNNFSSSISGSGKVVGQVDCTDFSSNVSGSGDVTFKGNCTNSTLKIAGSGSFNGNEFETSNANISISGSGTVHICVGNYLKANIAGSGKIKYRGSPKIDVSTSGTGSIKNVEN